MLPSIGLNPTTRLCGSAPDAAVGASAAAAALPITTPLRCGPPPAADATRPIHAAALGSGLPLAAAVTVAARGRRMRRLARGGQEAVKSKPLLLGLLETLDGFGRKLQNPILEGNYAPVHKEISASNLEVVEGALPEDFPDGVYVRNGPNPRWPTVSVQTPLGRTAHHWFDGEGMIHAVRFDAGKCSYTNRWVRTKDFLTEEAHGGSLYRPFLQATPPVSVLNIASNTQAFGSSTRDVANTSIIHHGGRLLCLTEGAAMPTEVSLEDLSTIGPYAFGSKEKLPSFTAHPRVDPTTGELVFAAYSFFESETGAKGVHTGVVGADGVLKHWTSVPSADRLTLMHDVAITAKWTLILDFPLTINPSGLLTGEGMAVFQKDAVARIGLVPRFGTDVEQWFEVENGYMFHVLSAFEDGDDVVLRGCFSRDMRLTYDFDDVDRFMSEYWAEDSGNKAGKMGTRLHEWRLHLKTGKVTERDVDSTYVDFPMINKRYEGQPHRYGYCTAFEADRSQRVHIPVTGSLMKYTFHESGEVTSEEHELPGSCIGQEPVFVQRPGTTGEDDGWILMLNHDMDSGVSEMHVVDAQKFTEPPVAKVALPQRVPFGFHGTFVPAGK
mmetsp:Transcript_80862/g.187747  ORF Transcript_80862/g.187747 Transcript_80862/m.187747 type:complete len:610 (+) Transcript_80862:63-1892(+)